MRSLGPEEDTSKLVGIRRGLYDVTIATTVAAPVKRATDTHFCKCLAATSCAKNEENRSAAGRDFLCSPTVSKKLGEESELLALGGSRRLDVDQAGRAFRRGRLQVAVWCKVRSGSRSRKEQSATHSRSRRGVFLFIDDRHSLSSYLVTHTAFPFIVMDVAWASLSSNIGTVQPTSMSWDPCI